MNKLSDQEMEDLVAALRSSGVLYARLFGSAARGRLGFDSDVDVAVSAARPLTGSEIADIVRRVVDAVGRPVDVVDLRTARGLVFREALSGTELFCDSEAARGEAQYRRVSVVEEDLKFARASFEAVRGAAFR